MAWTLPRLLRRLGAALVHTQYALPLRCPCPAVVTIHDLSFERDATLMGRRDRLVFRRVVPRAARRRARVLTVSERTKRDLVELYGIPPERIVVTPNGVDPAFRPERRTRRLAPYVLARRRDPGAEEPARGARRRPRGRARRSSSSARRRTSALARELARRGAALGATSPGRAARRALPRRGVPRAAVALRGLRAAGARGDGLRARRSSPCPTRRSSRSPATRPSSSEEPSSPTGSGARSPSATRLARGRARARARRSPGRRPRERRVARLPRGARP